MRFSIEPGDPGEKPLADLLRSGAELSVFLDGKPQKNVATADTELGFIEVYTGEMIGTTYEKVFKKGNVMFIISGGK
jgi:pyridoxine 5'-phosphate synthase PdxJ